MTGNRRAPKFQYSIPMHQVDRLPLIREESSPTLYYRNRRSDLVPFGESVKRVRFSPEESYIPPLPPLSPYKQRGSSSDVDGTTLRWLVSDYLNYARDRNDVHFPDVHVRHSNSCSCCSDRNIENLSKKGFPRLKQDYDKTSVSSQPLRYPSNYEKMIFGEEPTIGPRFTAVSDPSLTWAPSRDLHFSPRRRTPTAYLLPEISSTRRIEDLDDYIISLRYPVSPPNRVLDADEVYRAAMQRLQEQVHHFGNVRSL